MDSLITKEVMGGIQSTATSAVLVRLPIAMWGGKKVDKDITAAVHAEHGATGGKSSGSWHKFLLPNCKEFKSLQDLVRKTKEQHNLLTSPWDGRGQNILPNKFRVKHFQYLNEQKVKYWDLLEAFKQVYPQAILNERDLPTLAKTWNAADYPSADKMFDGKRFDFDFFSEPVPTTDWRIELEESGREELNAQLNRVHNSRMANAMQGLWEKLRVPLETMSGRLTDKPALMGETEDGIAVVLKPSRAQGFHQTLITNISEIVDVLDDLNFTGDEKLSETSRAVRAVLAGTDYDALKGSSRERIKTKEAVDNLLSRFEF